MWQAVHDQLDGFEVASWGRGELERAFRELSRLRAHVDERLLAITAAIDGLDDGGVDGEGMARSAGRRSARSAKQQAKTAGQLSRMPRTRRALAKGEINEEHAEAAAEAAERTSPEEADEELVGDARSRPADLFARGARKWADARDREDQREDAHARRLAAREFGWSDRPDQMLGLFGQLDPDNATRLRKRLAAEVDRLWRVDGGRDGDADAVRTPAQRRADALMNLVTGAAGASTAIRPVTGRAKRPHPKYGVWVAVDGERLRRDDPEGMARLVDGEPLPASVLERICCDSEFVGAIVAGDGAVLWQGRTTRLATDDQWIALVARDGGCVTGCGAPPEHCEAHHLVPFAGPGKGRTDIDAMALVCTREHHLIHDEGWQLVRLDDGTWRIEPPAAGARPTSRSRRRPAA